MANSGLHLYKAIEGRLTDKGLLKKLGLSKKRLLENLDEDNMKEAFAKIDDPCAMTYSQMICLWEPAAARYGSTPQEGWLSYLCETTVTKLFDDGDTPEDPACAGSAVLMWEVLDAFSDFKRKESPFDPTRDIRPATDEEIADSDTKDEYLRMMRACRKMHIFTFLMLEKEYIGFDTVGHVFGVHHVAMHVGRQLKATGTPVDLALISAAALAHDIGKFGCKGAEVRRIPYLHYYYTDKCLTRFGFEAISHIASNHSTWDLELENLSVESLLLIYADFRVKSRYEDGKEIIVFYSMREAFDVILGKLDNVDDKKRARYERVYSKIKDFEDFMKARGVSVYLTSDRLKRTKWVDPALLRPQQAVDRTKYLAVRYNIDMMHELRTDTSFGDILEDARSERSWNHTRAYLSMLEEYFTYMTMRQKQMTLKYLREQLINAEGDVRRRAGVLIGRIIANYQEHYRKELPDTVSREDGIGANLAVWEDHVRYVMDPEPQFTEQQRRWMGYTMKMTFNTVIETVGEEERQAYADAFFEIMRATRLNDEGIFIFLDTMAEIPLEVMREENVNRLITFIKRIFRRNELEIRAAALVMLLRLAEEPAKSKIRPENYEEIGRMTELRINAETPTSIVYLLTRMRQAMGYEDASTQRCAAELEKRYRETSQIFLENLKINTPWIIKTANIQFLLEAVQQSDGADLFFTATHLANLLKVSERITVRHNAGQGLLTLFEKLELEQRNEIAVELMKGLEIGNLEFSKYLPLYLGQIVLMLHPEELDEIVDELRKLVINGDEKTASVALETLGVIITHYPSYKGRFEEPMSDNQTRMKEMLGILLMGMANYRRIVSQESFMVLGQYVFGSPLLSLDEKFELYRIVYKKALILIAASDEINLTFFSNAAALNNLYRFISDYVFFKGHMRFRRPQRIAFFPGTFDPFSLSHKGIVTTIRDMGYEVYLAIDEFSWSKKTQPRGIRHNIISMTMAGETDVYVFPENLPINIANNDDLAKLEEIFPKERMYMVVGSDVVSNASSYRLPKTEHSIHTFNHLIFRRKSTEDGSGSYGSKYRRNASLIEGDIVELTLPVQLEDISSTRIRHNIDENRDISSLIDPVAQNYIYEYGLYKREPQFKSIAHRSNIRITRRQSRGNEREVAIYEGSHKRQLGYVRTCIADNQDLLVELGDSDLAAFIRNDAPGRILMIREFHVADTYDKDYLYDLLLTETLLRTLEKGFAYAVYQSDSDDRESARKIRQLRRMGFQRIRLKGTETNCYTVNMHNPVVLFHDMETVLKDPFDKDERVIRAIQNARDRMMESLVRMFPDTLVLSIDTPVMNQRIIEKITRENGVSNIHSKRGKRGPYMCVPFGKILNGLVVPNTVTKTLHIQKFFEPDLSTFSIRENQFYASIDNQVATIHSFGRPVILVDDLLHKGYRMKRLDPLLKKYDVEVHKIIVGLMSGSGMDLMNVQGRDVESVYYIPNLRVWFTESLEYPFIAGDAMTRGTGTYEDTMRAINLIMPYVIPRFLSDRDPEALADFSMTCLTNARNIFEALEEAYQDIYQKKMTVRRIPEAIRFSRLPDVGWCLDYDMSLAPSEYINTDIERLSRLMTYKRPRKE